MLGHEMRVHSRPGRGSCFTVCVPLASAEAIESRPQPAAKDGDPSPLEGLVVLCVDNEDEILDGMRLLLERWGCTVWPAANLRQAEQRIEEFGAPHFLLLDYHLGEQGNGLDVAATIDSLVDANLPAIIITADRSSTLEEAVRGKGYGLLRKPIRPAALRTLITNLLKAS
jgi:CheY-like chemotaxis protein